MKLTKKQLPHLLGLIFAGIVVGTLIWELLAVLAEAGGFDLRLTVGPIGFDVTVLAVWLQLNPGSLAGGIGGALLFRKI